jgi:hypothetical protein
MRSSGRKKPLRKSMPWSIDHAGDNLENREAVLPGWPPPPPLEAQPLNGSEKKVAPIVVHQNPTMLPVYRIDPIKDERWVRLLDEHPDASIFHTPGWLEALKRTYGYEPVAFTTSAPGARLSNGLVFCHVRSWATGSRLVSLPFSDHCQPLMDGSESLKSLLSPLQQEAQHGQWKYIEIKPLLSSNLMSDSDTPMLKGDQFYFHRLDLQSDTASIFRRFHKSCIQRKIRRAERENLSYETGRSLDLLRKFYQLLVLTRRRHQLPPQPFVWFRNLVDCFGDRLTIRLLSKEKEPVASILTLAHRTTLVYKYGCSDERFHNLGGMPLLFWIAIQEAKESGFQGLDLGRSELDNSGLVQFKGHLGAVCSSLGYYRYPAQSSASALRTWGSRTAQHIFSRVPDSVLVPMGRLLYKHLG